MRLRLILCRYLILDPVVFLLRDDASANQLRSATIGAPGDYAIRSLAAHSGQAEQLIFSGGVYIERLVAIPSFFHALSQRLRVLLDV